MSAGAPPGAGRFGSQGLNFNMITEPHSASGTAAPPALAARAIYKSFGPIRVLDRVDFDVRAGEVHALVGENGAGKTTLLRILTGREQSSEGALTVGGQTIPALTPALAKAHGISVVPQHVELADHLSVADNIFLNRWPTRRGLIDMAAMRREAVHITQRVGLRLDPDRLVNTLSYVEKQMLEIARLSEFDPRVIVLDEPTAALSVKEIRVLFALIRRLQKAGIAVIYVSHYLNEITNISDRVTVLRGGKVVASYLTRDTNSQRITYDMVGEIADLYPRRDVEPGVPILEVRNASFGHLDNVSLQVRAGEVVGLVGAKGEGISDFLRTICSVVGRLTSGTVWVRGKQLSAGHSRAAMRLGLGYLSEERGRWGIFPGRSVAENVSISSFRDFMWLRWFLDLARERRMVDEALQTYLVRTPSPESDIRNLSGGNQQKALLARLFQAKLDVYVLDDPTLGVDVGSKAEINRLMNKEVTRGAGILLSTSDLPEVLEMSDRVLVVRRGRIVREAARGSMHLAELEMLLEGEGDD
jgi:ABC-type sugar transport system ATPase subunit